MVLSEKRVDLPPFALWELRAGDRGTPVVLVHGLSGSSRWWSRNIPALAKEHRVAAVDLTGFGRTRRFGTPTPLPPSFDSLVETLIRWLEQTFHEPVHLVGHSMGGQIAIRLTDRRPDLVRSLVLVSSSGIPLNFSLGTRLRNLMVPAAGLVSFSPLLLWDFLRAGPTSVAVASAHLLADDARPAMQRVRVPTLILWGEHDPLLPLSHAQQIKDAIPGSRLIILPDAGHVAMWDAADEFNRVVRDFLLEVDTPSPPRPFAPSRPRSFNWGVAGILDGISYRVSGEDPGVLLIHGLGIGSRYFSPLAQELHQRGITALAPDLPGCGYSAERPEPVRDYGAVMLRWLEKMNLPVMYWAGHSTGCQLVRQMFALAPERSRGCIDVSPPWNRASHPWWKLAGGLFLDAWREPPALIAHAIRAYWASGLLHVLKLARFYVPDSRRASITHSRSIIAGRSDPLIDPELFPPHRFQWVPGAHGIVYSSPAEVAEELSVILSRTRRERRQ